MAVKLKVLHGALKKNDRLQVVVPITSNPFVIGRSSDCDMRCHSQAISRRHCEIRVSGLEVTLVDLDSRNGVRVNGEVIRESYPLKSGDRLAIGRLEFELIIEIPKPRADADPLGELVCEMLVEADRQEAADQEPESRWYRIEPAEPVDPYEGMSKKEILRAKAREKIPTKQPPRKLPKLVTDSVHDAIGDTLAKQGTDADRYYRGAKPPQAAGKASKGGEDTQVGK